MPLIAPPGHASRHIMHFPHLDSRTGSPTSRGASVNTELILNAEPYPNVVRSADFPIQPRPERVAMVL